MKIEKKLYFLLFVLQLASCRVAHGPPDFTLCAYLESGKIYCANNSIPDLKNGKELDIKPSDIVMTPDNFKIFLNYGAKLREDLIRCENGR